ncbi:multiheme c-type cytochrome [Aeoliella sp.]|uniref:multiheme c-type cytochrome n=1 Tax=Aeoliella sp. TaxID=2795800 RepID=UPI003CCC347A
MPRTAISRRVSGGRMLRALLATLVALVVVHTAWQCFPTREEPDTVTPVAETRPAGEVDARTAEIERLVAEVAVVCPTSAAQLRTELLAGETDLATLSSSVAPTHELTSHFERQPRASITSVRVAQRPVRMAVASGGAPQGEWLVDPDAWFVPEDASSAPIDVSPSVEPTAEPANVSPPVVPDASVEPSAPAEPVRIPPPPPADEGPSFGTAPSQSAPPAQTPVELPAEPPMVEPEVAPVVEPAQPAKPEPRPSLVAPPQLPGVEESKREPAAEPALPPVRVEPPQPPVETRPREIQPEPTRPRPRKPMFEAPSAPSNMVVPLPAAPKPVAPEPAVPNPVVEPQPTAGPRSAPTQETLPAPPVEPSPSGFAPPSLPTPKVQPIAPRPAEAGAPVETIPQPGFAPPPLGMPSLHSSPAHSLEEARAAAKEAGVPDGVDPHLELIAEGCYPSAKTCAKCHEKIYKEWSCSSHAYAAVSPMFQKFEQKITEVSKGTVGYFCLRCHSPVGTSLNIRRDVPLWEQPEVAREGVTCVACHRVNQRYDKSNGERHIVPGNEFAPVYGGKGGVGVAEAIAKKDHFKLKTSPDEKGPGQAIHVEGRYFDQISRSEYCTSCHQVAVHPGIKLEVVWDQYRASPAYKAGITCQDCHMGKEPGLASGYECCAVAEIAGKKVRENVKHSNHIFYGPGYSIAHPGVFPFHLKADRWKFNEWLQFDWRAGWGTDKFEERVEDGTIRVHFPPVWAEVDDRYDAREIIDDNLELLATKTEVRKKVMENGSHVDGPFFKTTPAVGRELKLNYVVSNTNTGHNLPTASLGAQPQLWANVVLIGPQGQRLWETGYTDHYGDVCDIHSRDVRAGKVPFDSQLFNLQTMFLITGAVGTDREFYLPVNVDFDQLPFLRPGAIPVTVTNHPPFIRMESRSLAPLGKKEVKYRIPAEVFSQPGRYRLSFRMRSRTEPIYFMDFCGATPEMQRAMNEGMIDVHPYSVEFDVR